MLCPNPEPLVRPTAAALVRLAEGGQRVLLLDEVQGHIKNDMLKFLDTGYRRGSATANVTGNRVVRYEPFAPVALAGVEALPDMLMSRAIQLVMYRPGPDVVLERLVRVAAHPEVDALRHALAEWASCAAPGLVGVVPNLPAAIRNRPAELWSPLVAVADIVGGEWPQRSRRACIELERDRAGVEASDPVEVLRAMKTMFEQLDCDAMATADAVDRLNAIPDAPWASRPFTVSTLADLLRDFGVRSRNSRRSGPIQCKCYLCADVATAIDRFAPGVPDSDLDLGAATAQRSMLGLLRENVDG